MTTHLIRPAPAAPGRVDPRGQRFAAALTTIVLIVVLLLAPSPLAVALLAAQGAVFAVGSFLGVQQLPQAWVFRAFIHPRLGPPAELEDPAPPSFAQGVGLVFALVGVAGFLVGAPLIGMVATGMALAAAVLNAAFGLCLGCELYLLLLRLRRRS